MKGRSEWRDRLELFHGAVLTKLLRSDRPVSLRLVEKHAGAATWSTYTINDEVNLFIAHSKAGRTVQRDGGGTSWSFVFSPNQLRQLNPANAGRPVYAALVCGGATLRTGPMQVCLLEPAQLAELLDFTATQQGITVRKPQRRGQFRIFKDREERFLVPLSRLDTWEIPGA